MNFITTNGCGSWLHIYKHALIRLRNQNFGRMKTATVLLFLGLVRPGWTSSCSIYKGHAMNPSNCNDIRFFPKLEFPCKYKMIDQECGGYRVRVTAGNVYMAPHFVINSVWVSVKKGNDSWQGRTTNNIAMKYINDQIDEPFITKGGNLNFAQLFNFQKLILYGTNQTYIGFSALTKDRRIKISFYPYNITLIAHRGILDYNCWITNYPPPFPQQLCGKPGECRVIEEATRLGLLEDGLFTQEAGDRTFCYYVFTNNKTNQSPEPRCSAVVNTMLTTCASEAERAWAISLCYRTMYSRPHRKCISKNSCDLIDAFHECVKFACSNFRDETACQALGECIDGCENFRGLSSKVKKCYEGLHIP